MDQYAVIGNPISHSKSPLIHSLFAQQTRQELEYKKIESPLDGFALVVKQFFDNKGKGLNVTVPFKEEAWSLCEKLSERAHLAGAVNTLYCNEDGLLCGDNTDGVGLVNDLKNNHVQLEGKKILIIGAGGAVRGVLQPILNERPTAVVITNRTLSKAEALVGVFSDYSQMSSQRYDQLNESFDVVINGTSASLNGELPNISGAIFSPDTCVYDMMYSKEDTIFNAWAKKCKVNAVYDGLGMLVEQAAEAFQLWRGLRPETREVIQLLRDA
jgi:shikimate dehydrogenase